MSTDRPRWRRAPVRILAVLGACIALSGCIVYPYGPGYYRPYYRPYHYWY